MEFYMTIYANILNTYVTWQELCLRIHGVLLWLGVLVLLILLRVTSQAPGKSYDCLIAGEATLHIMGKYIIYIPKTKNDKTMYLSHRKHFKPWGKLMKFWIPSSL